MNYWDIVLFILAVLGVCAVFGFYMFLLTQAFYNGRRLVGWSMVGVLAALFIFGLPLLIVSTGGAA